SFVQYLIVCGTRATQITNKLLENGALLFNRVGREGFESNCGFSMVTILPVYLFFTYLFTLAVVRR
ncbi:hypothetical protein AB6C98_27095, partial [Vibrio splendidus]